MLNHNNDHTSAINLTWAVCGRSARIFSPMNEIQIFSVTGLEIRIFKPL